MCLLETVSCLLVLLFRFDRAREGDMWRGEEASPFLLSCTRSTPYKLQQGFGGRLASPSLLLSSLFNKSDTALKPELV